MLELLEGREQSLIRYEKLKKIERDFYNPYMQFFKPNTYANQIIENYNNFEGKEVKVAGRIISKRIMGKIVFAHIRDISGKIQLFVRVNDVGKKNFSLFKELDIGDIVGATGIVFKTKTEETSIQVKDFVLLAKCLHTPPIVKEKEGKVFDEFKDIELRYRKRYIDLIVNPWVLETFVIRSKIIKEIRKFLDEKGFLEVETPMMQIIPGGAKAKPFITHHNALDIDLYLRIAPELYLKRLIVGGFQKVYELNRNFRNEGISTRHNPEFTMLELYSAYSNYMDMMELCEELFCEIAKKEKKSLKFRYLDYELDFTPPWKRISFVDIIKQETGLDFKAIKDKEEAYKLAESIGVEIEEKNLTKWQIAEYIFEEKIEEKLSGPIFITDYPTELSPLAKQREDDPEFVERFEPYIAGREVGNAFSELNDPREQYNRFKEQLRLRELGDEEAHRLDYDYIEALQYGMPPTGGMGIGIDRLIMIFINTASIKDTILFPLLKPEKNE
jgi:lysyl-tRNA synthetase class 2